MNRLGEINTEIDRLQKERTRLLNEQKFGDEEFIKSLEWTKDCCALLEICSLGGCGLPKYKIHVSGAKLPSIHETINVMGGSMFYEENMMLGKDWNVGNTITFYTNSEKTLFEFLEKVTFLKFLYNEKHLMVLEAARKKANEYNYGRPD